MANSGTRTYRRCLEGQEKRTLQYLVEHKQGRKDTTRETGKQNVCSNLKAEPERANGESRVGYYTRIGVKH